MKNKNMQGGITLVALVITIIILLILAGITISQLIGSGLLKKANQSKEKTEYANAKEIIEIQIMQVAADCYGSNKEFNIKEIANNIKKVENITIEKYYNEKTSNIKNGATENLVNLNGIVVSVNDYNKYKFLIDKDGKIIGVSINQITDTTKEEEFKDIDDFEKDMFGEKINSSKNEEKDILVQYTAKDVESRLRPLKLNDKTSNNINADIVNAKYNNKRNGIVFNGSNTYATIDSNTINLSYPTTISTAVKWEKGSNNLLFIDAESKIAIGTWNNEILLTVGDNYSYSYSLPEKFFENEINYITVQYNGNKDNVLYVNGEKMKKSSYYGSWDKSESGIYIGRRASGSYFKGIVYDFSIYNRLLTEEEIISKYNNDKMLYENNSNVVTETSENLVLRYSCSEGNNNEEEYLGIIKDKLNNKYNITLEDVNYNNTKNGLIFNGNSSYGILEDDSLEISFPNTITIVAKSNKYENNILFTNKKSKIGIGLWKSKYIILQNDSDSAPFYDIQNSFKTDDINYITAVYKNDASDSILYLNGNKITESLRSDGWAKNEKGTYIGRRNNGSYFDGTLYKIKIYKKALSEDEIIKEYQKDKEYYEKNN